MSLALASAFSTIKALTWMQKAKYSLVEQKRTQSLKCISALGVSYSSNVCVWGGWALDFHEQRFSVFFTFKVFAGTAKPFRLNCGDFSRLSPSDSCLHTSILQKLEGFFCKPRIYLQTGEIIRNSIPEDAVQHLSLAATRLQTVAYNFDPSLLKLYRQQFLRRLKGAWKRLNALSWKNLKFYAHHFAGAACHTTLPAYWSHLEGRWNPTWGLAAHEKISWVSSALLSTTSGFIRKLEIFFKTTWETSEGFWVVVSHVEYRGGACQGHDPMGQIQF